MALIFLVEDDITLQKAYRSVLESAGYSVISALNGYDAILKYELLPEEPEIILLDHRMPEKEGLTTAEEILAMNPGATIIFLSADIIVKHAALQMGAGFLVKPFTREELLSCIRGTKKQPLRHIVTLVSNAEDKRERVLPFLRHGFYRREKCLYLTSEPCVEFAQKNLILSGVKEDFISAFTIFPMDEWYDNLKSQPQTVINCLDQFIKENLKEETEYLRLVIEIAVSEPDLDSVFKFESLFQKFLEKRSCIRSLCAYQVEQTMDDVKSSLVQNLKEIGLEGSFYRS